MLEFITIRCVTYHGRYGQYQQGALLTIRFDTLRGAMVALLGTYVEAFSSQHYTLRIFRLTPLWRNRHGKE